MRDVNIAITAASYSGNKGAAAMLQSSIKQLHDRYGKRLNVFLMSVYPTDDKKQCPWDFVTIIPSGPVKILIAFILAVLYKVFHFIPPIKYLLLKNQILRTYKQTDVVLDEAGVALMDSRSFVMNVYAFMTNAIPLLMGAKVVKYSQALGPFKKAYNKILAKILLPKISLICARGEITLESLHRIGISKNVVKCADGAFTMEDNEEIEKLVEERCKKDDFFLDKNIVGVSPSTVVNKKCTKKGIDYVSVIAGFIDKLTSQGYKVYIIANSAIEGSTATRNNDLMICDAVYEKCGNKDNIRWYHEEMDAEEIRSYIGRCRFVVASRFHTMIGALQRKVPCLLIGWSHKYQEVLDFFECSGYATDFSNLTSEKLYEDFCELVEDEEDIRVRLDKNYDSVMESSYENIKKTSEVIDAVIEKPKKYKLLDYNNPEKYIGEFVETRVGYATDDSIRENAASGGVVTAFLCFLLRKKIIDGAWICRTVIADGKVAYDTFIATTEDEIRSGSSSIYMSVPMMKHIDVAREFDGKLAVVMLPCMLKAFSKVCEKDAQLREKVVIKLGLFCSGNHSEKATEMAFYKAGVSLDNAKKFYYRRGHWRGLSSVLYNDGNEKTFSYTKYLCSYKNAFYFEQESCMACQNHFAKDADISFGDVWLKEIKDENIKPTGIVIRNENAKKLYDMAKQEGVISDRYISGSKVVKSQKRALVFKYNCAKAKVNSGIKADLDTSDPCRWNHKLAFKLAKRNKKRSENFDSLKKVPTTVIYYYMCFVRFLLNF
ncbi:polysaccharide pyruvyl transferase family protein [Butyrivibrio sp. WCD3002]|uniref:polysaccharide pyruvyl transferase family protein n=1 Tax=Butyrivibrio sp. WCD3002 TaxID=1280676 RepID=UPI00040C1B46|nr:polysaccharide pyruvyl transferase family protein [Butyrivibrio sp. WCD3002]